MKPIKRRKFLTGAITGATLGLNTLSGGQVPGKRITIARPVSTIKSHRSNRIAVSTYSFWRFKRGLRMSIEECIEKATEMGFDGIDILHRQMDQEDDSYLQSLKRRALVNGVALWDCQSIKDLYLPIKRSVRIMLSTP